MEKRVNATSRLATTESDSYWPARKGNRKIVKNKKHNPETTAQELKRVVSDHLVQNKMFLTSQELILLRKILSLQ